MTSSLFLSGQISNLPEFDSIVVHVVELTATYLIHSTLFLVVGWALLPVLLWLFTKRSLVGQERPSYAPALTERVWKLAAVLALATAPLSVLTGWSRPAFEWSFIEKSVGNETAVVHDSLDNASANRRVTPPVATSLADEVAAARPLIESSASLTVEESSHPELAPAPAELSFDPSFDESVAELRAEAALLALNRLDNETIESSTMSSNERPRANELSEPTLMSDKLIDTASHHSEESHSNSVKLAWLGCGLLAWFAVSLGRMLAKGVVLHRRLARCQPATGELSKTLNKLLGREHSVRLLQSTTAISHTASIETYSPNANGVGAKVGTALIAPTPLALGLNVKSSHSGPCEVAEEPLTLSLQRRGEGKRKREAAITEPFACGLFRWTIVLPAGIEQSLSPSEMRALLAHEVAHLVRRDPWWLWLGELLCTCLAFQPLNFLARRRWQAVAELLCDDWAVERHVSATSLASCLTKLAEWRLDRRTAWMGLRAVGRSGSLTQRIEWLLRNGRASEPKRPRARLVATLTTFALGLFVGLYGPRLTLVVPVEASASRATSDGEFTLIDSSLADSSDGDAALAARLWSDIKLELHHTLIELARLESRLATDSDPEVTSLANRLRIRVASLKERVDP